MKAELLKIANLSDTSFSFEQFKQTNINSKWHFHPELELIHIHQGEGTQFTGDNVRNFTSGDICLIGKNIPHFWRFDETFTVTSNEHVCSSVIHFEETLWGRTFFDKPENLLLKKLIEKSNRGILIKGDTKEKIAALIKKLQTAEGSFRLVYLLECLAVISAGDEDEVITLSSLGFESQLSQFGQDRINIVYEYSFKNFKEKIPLEVIAEKAGLVPSSFCRYFKSKTGKSYTQFIKEIKVSYACKLLKEDKLSVKEVCYECGFNNFSSFHKQFKVTKGVSPKKYRKTNLIKPLKFISDLV